MLNKMVRWAALVSISLSPALTQGQTQRKTELEVVVVTAEKREASLQDTPISIAAFDTESLEKLGIAGIADIGANVPNLNISTFPTSQTTLRVFIRGIGITDVQITQDPAVGVYLNGVYIARSSGLALDIADLQRIEVLRGPQGTLYGRNSIGGALNLVTAPPTLKIYISVKLSAPVIGTISNPAHCSTYP